MKIPKHMYKYRRFDAYALSSIANQAVWLAKPNTFNDPFDCAITLDCDLYKESILHAISVSINEEESIKKLEEEWPGDKEAFETLQSGITEIFQNIGICSFSKQPDIFLLWSHYADNHRGFCIEYDCSEKSGLRNVIKNVRYSDTVPKLSAADLSEPNKNETFDMLWLTKAKCWEYEQEWRLIHNKGNTEAQSPSKITSVIFGVKMPVKDRVTIMNILNYDKTIKFKEAVLVEGEFKIDIVTSIPSPKFDRVTSLS